MTSARHIKGCCGNYGRALGLAQGTAESSFDDVTLSDWFNGYVDTTTWFSACCKNRDLSNWVNQQRDLRVLIKH